VYEQIYNHFSGPYPSLPGLPGGSHRCLRKCHWGTVAEGSRESGESLTA